MAYVVWRATPRSAQGRGLRPGSNPALTTILCTEPARRILVHFTAAELYSRFHGRCRERPQGALERMVGAS